MPTRANRSKYEIGLQQRKEVLGEEYATRFMNGPEFARPNSEFVTEMCWGNVWARPGLPRKTRSLILLGILSALNRPEEFKLHVRGAIRNGCTKEEIQEVLLQVTAYCGAPAGVGAFRLANEVLSEPKVKSDSKMKVW